MLSPTRPLLIGFSLALVAVNATVAQKLNPKRPSVYLTFRDFVAKTPDPAYPSQGARLALHNNTRWPIYYTGHYDPTVAAEQIIYIIELANGQRDPRTYVDVVRSGIKIMPGKSLIFTVPRGDFPKDSQIYVEFNFSWEVRDGDTVRDETVHRAYFLSSDLPPWPK